MKYMNCQLEEVKNSIAVTIINFAKECSTNIYTLEQYSIDKEKLNNQKIQQLKKEILKLKMELVEGQICRQARPEPKTDPKPQVSTSRSSFNTPSNLFTNQPTRLLKKHIMNAGKHINVIVNEDRVQKQMPTERKSIQECHLLRSNKKK